MKNNKTNYRIFSADFETTSYSGQTKTEVWAAACVELWSEDCKIFNSIREIFNYFLSFKDNILAYFHNLKFDGCFWLSFLKKEMKFTEAYTPDTTEFVQYHSDMKNNTIKYAISSDGQWYYIQVKVNNKLIEFRDSYKLLPFSVKAIGKGFNTKHKKLDMEYEGYRYAGCNITDEEKEYIKNDVLVVKEALEEMYKENHTKLTIGSCCLSEYKSIHKSVHVTKYADTYPDLKEIPLNVEIYGSKNADEYIRKSYRGGWCYVVKGKENKIFKNGVTADVNSLYPSVMHSESFNSYPIGLPTFWTGNFPSKEIENGILPIWDEQSKIPTVIGTTYQYYYFVRILTRFKLKKNKLPCIQIKKNYRYRSNEYQETSDVWSRTLNKYCTYYKDADGKIRPARVELTLTRTDYELIQEQYNLYDTEILDGCYFKTDIGLFDEYINKYKKIKMENKGAKRTIAKLFLNSLYGKMATGDNSSYKTAYVKEDKSLGFTIHVEHNKKVGYIPIGSAITSYARNFTIRAAQANYYGKSKHGFIYADTDSIHCDLSPDELKGIKVHDTKFNHWKLESCWDTALFVRQKTYIEHITKEDMKDVKPYYNIKCAGLPQNCKDMLNYSLTGTLPENLDKYTDEEIKFMSKKRKITDFNIGLKIPSKLIPVRIEGGVVLMKTTFEMKNFMWTR